MFCLNNETNNETNEVYIIKNLLEYLKVESNQYIWAYLLHIFQIGHFLLDFD